MTGPRKPRRPTEAELALWRQVAKTTTPLSAAQKSERRTDLEPPSGGSPPAPALGSVRSSAKKPPREPQVVRPKGDVQPPIRYTPTRPDVGKAAAGAPGLDRNTARRLGRGALEPEARIDLHGMTAERAHRALTRFILSAHAGGKRCVLVITGKGGRPRDADLGQIRDYGGGAGVLKTLTPEWLRSPPLVGLVVGLFQAHTRHGGDGALYVYLRKNPAKRHV